MEEWKDVYGYGCDYQVSNYGRVKRIFKHGSEKILAYKMQGNRQTVRLQKKDNNKDYWHVLVANLVAKAFIPKDTEWQDYVEHIDGDTRNNKVENLKWSEKTNKEVTAEYSRVANLKGKNEYRIDGDLAYVKLHNTGREMICDADIWMKYKHRTWNEHSGYAKTNIHKKEYAFHQFVKECPEGYVTDHINRNRFDNRAVNLRITTQYVNTLNRNANYNSSTKVKGVFKEGNGYRADIKVKKKRIYLGHFRTIEEAKQARIEAEEKYYKPIIEKETLLSGCFFNT